MRWWAQGEWTILWWFKCQIIHSNSHIVFLIFTKFATHITQIVANIFPIGFHCANLSVNRLLGLLFNVLVFLAIFYKLFLQWGHRLKENTIFLGDFHVFTKYCRLCFKGHNSLTVSLINWTFWFGSHIQLNMLCK